METKIDKILIQEFGMLNTSTSPDFFNGGRPTKKVVQTLTKRIRVENIKRLGNAIITNPFFREIVTFY